MQDASCRPGPYWSLMFEISESQYKPVPQTPVALGDSAGEGLCPPCPARQGCHLAMLAQRSVVRAPRAGTLHARSTSLSPCRTLPARHRHMARGGARHAAGRDCHQPGAARG